MSSKKKGKGKGSTQEESLTEQKKNRKAANAESERQRRLERDLMEKMVLASDEEDDDDSEDEKGKKGPEMTTDSFGNTISKAKLEADKETEKLRAEAKARREAKKAAEGVDGESNSMSGKAKKEKKDKVHMTRREELDMLKEKELAGEKLSNRERKMLTKYQEELEEEVAMQEEYSAGLESFSLTLGGKSTGEEGEGETYSAVDIVVPSFTITAPNRVLFQDAQLKLSNGKRYGVLGPNGRGKSTLLKFLAARRIPVPEGIDVLLAEQEVHASDDSVVEQVLSADTRRTALLKEEIELNEKIDRGDDDGEGLEKLVERLQAVGEELDAIGAYSREAKVRRILGGLGFTEKMQEENSRSLSGGWRMRVSLAKTLFVEPRLLLLDEPTNHLDLDAVLWLEDYIATQWSGTCLIVSHDADFLDAVCTNILNVDDMKLNSYSGSYGQFLKMKNQIFAKKNKDWNLQQKTIQSFKVKGITEENAIKKTLEKLGWDKLMEGQPREYRVRFSFKDADDDFPSISVNDVSFTYPPINGVEQPEMFHELRFNVGPSDKIAIVGPNGAGKSTLLRLMTGRLEPTSGYVTLHKNLRIGIYDQHFEDLLPLRETPIAFLMREYDIPEMEARKYLGMFGLDGARHLIKIGDLSGGQKARVVFASLSLKKPHILILDEPTNNLDLESVDALIAALTVYKGGVIVVSHDTRLITALGCQIWVCEGAHLGAKAATKGSNVDESGVRIEYRGFERYRIDVMRQINALAEKQEEAAEALAQKRKEERAARLAKATGKDHKVSIRNQNTTAAPPPPPSDEEQKAQDDAKKEGMKAFFAKKKKVKGSKVSL